MRQGSQQQPAGASAPSKPGRWPAPMDSAMEGISEREHVAERFEEFARKLVEATKPAKSKKRARTTRKS